MHSRVTMLVTAVGLVLACFGSSVSAALASPPTIDEEWVTGVTPTSATLNAEINPSGLLTKYKLQIDTTGHFNFNQNDSCVLHPPGIVCAQVLINGEPLPPGLVEPPESSLAASFESQHVSVNMASIGATLQPGTTYHYRAIAANGTGSAFGPDLTFTTPSGTGTSPIDLTVNIEEGEGTVVSSPAGIECGPSCDDEFKEGSQITLTASPALGYAFKGWRKCDAGGVEGRQCTVAMTSAKEVGAKFVKVWNLSASKAGNGLGRVQTSQSGILCLYNCPSANAAFREGSVTVKESKAPYSHFVRWLGDCEGTAETCVLNMSENHAVEAEFAPDAQYVLSLAKEGGGQGSVKTKPPGISCGFTCGSSAASFYENEAIAVSVKLSMGTTKLTWTNGEGTCTGSTEALETTCTVKMDEARSLVAKFD